MPKAFISYSWTSKEHQQWVLDLATALRNDGVDALLDKWDLREGHDAIAFMERMVTDPSIDKVIMVLDRRYAEKADDRKGGVGTETQILTPQIYARADQNKFVGVASEVDADGKAFKPAYYASRIHIDMSNADLYAENYEQLLRWIFDKPSYPKPPLGKSPEFLKEETVLIPTRTHAQRAIGLFRSGSSAAIGALDGYFDSLAENFDALRIPGDGSVDFDEKVLSSISAFLPYREEFVSVLTAAIKSGLPSEEYIASLKKFFEQLIPFMYRPRQESITYDHSYDNYRFIIHELFLYAVATLIKNERFTDADNFLAGGFYAADVPDFARDESFKSYTVFRNFLPSLQRRNERLQLRRLTLHADLLKDRVPARGVSLDDLMQADLVLFIRATALRFNRWWPETLIWSSNRYRPFEIFARAESMKYFERISRLFGAMSRDQFVEMLTSMTRGPGSQYLPSWHFDSPNWEEITGLAKLGAKT
jgi:hypothetical protein